MTKDNVKSKEKLKCISHGWKLTQARQWVKVGLYEPNKKMTKFFSSSYTKKLLL